jgi:hypothetical protein
VGFYITLDVSPQIAYARLFIDVGLAIGLVAVILAFYREPQLATDIIIQGLKNLKNGKYKTRLNAQEHGPLAELSNSINDLAKYLESQQEKQEEIKRNLREELLPKKPAKEMPAAAAPAFPEHSFHPELGPVFRVSPLETGSPSTLVTTNLVSPSSEVKLQAEPIQNTFVESQPPVELKLEEEEQDLGELYQRFVDAQREIEHSQIEYPVFLKTIEQSRAQLMKAHTCRAVLFDVVKEPNQIALQPRILR